jgi:SAM-dependent methyltransferase
MRDAWGEEAGNWVRWVRAGLDAGWDFTRPAFLRLLPAPGRLTLDVGCGEGRLGRVLQETGYKVIGVDVTVTLARAAVSHSQPLSVLVADAARLAVRDRAADLVVAFMSLQDIDDFAGAVHKAARVLEPGRLFCFAIVHTLGRGGPVPGRGNTIGFNYPFAAAANPKRELPTSMRLGSTRAQRKTRSRHSQSQRTPASTGVGPSSR